MWTSIDSGNFGPRERLDERHRVGGRVLALAIDLGERLAVRLAVLSHQATTSTPMERAVPAMIGIASSTVWAFRSGSFFSAIARS